MTNSHNCLLIPSDNIKVTVLVLVNGIGIFDQVMNSTNNLHVKVEIYVIVHITSSECDNNTNIHPLMSVI